MSAISFGNRDDDDDNGDVMDSGGNGKLVYRLKGILAEFVEQNSDQSEWTNGRSIEIDVAAEMAAEFACDDNVVWVAIVLAIMGLENMCRHRNLCYKRTHPNRCVLHLERANHNSDDRKMNAFYKQWQPFVVYLRDRINKVVEVDDIVRFFEAIDGGTGALAIFEQMDRRRATCATIDQVAAACAPQSADEAAALSLLREVEKKQPIDDKLTLVQRWRAVALDRVDAVLLAMERNQHAFFSLVRNDDRPVRVLVMNPKNPCY